MTDAFQQLEHGRELKYARDEEKHFKVASRRDRLLGLWLAESFGLSGSDAEAYAKDVVFSDVTHPGDDAVVEKVMADIEKRGAAITESDVRSKMEALFRQVSEQMKAE